MAHYQNNKLAFYLNILNNYIQLKYTPRFDFNIFVYSVQLAELHYII